MYMDIKGRPVLLTPFSILQSNVQRVTLTIAAGNTEATATISSVDMDNTRLKWGGWKISGDIATPNKFGVRVDLQDATTVRARRETSDATYSVTVSVNVVEYIAGVIQNMYRGDITISAGNSNQDTDPGFSFDNDTGNGTEFAFLGSTTDYSTNKNIDHLLARCQFQDVDTFRCPRWGTSGNTKVSVEAAKYSSTYLRKVHSGSNSSGTRKFGNEQDFTFCFDECMTISYAGDITAGESDLQGALKGLHNASASGIIYDKGISNAVNPSHIARNKLQWQPGIVKRKASNGGTTITNGNSSATVVYPDGVLDPNKTCVEYTGQATSSYTKTTVDYSNVWCRVSYDGDDTVTLDRGGTSGDNRPMYQLTEYW